MKIDLHCHTKFAKKGDVGREVSVEKFTEKMHTENVGIVAITNHNIFSRSQYNELVEKNEDILILPGIELDVIGNKSGKSIQGHVIVITDPIKINNLEKLINENCNGDPNEINLSIEDFCKTFGRLKNSIILCHYKKDKALSNDDIKYIKENIDYTNVALLEPSNAKKAGIIVMSESESSWFGSDHHNWDKYPNDGDPNKVLPECIFNISKYDSLFNLLKNNPDAVLLKTLLNKKGPEEVSISPFSNLSLNLQLYKDINVIFGGKATGKTEILKDIEKKLIEKGKTVKHFYIEDKIPDLKVLFDYKPSEEEFKVFREKNCSSEFDLIKKWNWKELPSINSFYKAKKSEEATTLLKKSKIINAKFSEVLTKSDIENNKNILLNEKTIIRNMKEIEFRPVLLDDEIKTLNELLDKLILGKENYFFESMFDYESKRLEKFTIDFIGKKITDLQGAFKAPSSYGLIQVYEEQKQLELSIKKIKDSLNFKVILSPKVIGRLPAKGDISRITNIGFKPQPVSRHKEFKRQQVHNQCKAKDEAAFEKLITKFSSAKNISEYLSAFENLKNHIIENNYTDLYFFVNYSNIYKTDDIDDFKPSNGEASILLVDLAINDNSSDVIILDEPDSGMGADFVNEILIPSIKQQARANKIVVISTHEPNLVVRTHPYTCIYREECKSNEYKTYIGSSFEETMKNYLDENDTKNWAQTCIEKCEGGNEALRERERTYGHY